MSTTYGIESPHRHHESPDRPRARYLVLIDAAGASIAKLCDAERRLVTEIDGGVEEVAGMIRGLEAREEADEPVWDNALRGHHHDERAAARVYTLEP